MKICGVYEISCSTSNKVLIGSSVHIKRRYSQHIYELRRNNHHNPHLQSAFNLHGEDSFNLTVLEECEQNSLLVREDWWIENKRSRDNSCGYNFKMAERPLQNSQTIALLSNLRKGENNPMYGKKLSKEHKDRISKSLKGIKRSFSEEARKNMSRAQKGKKLSEKTKEKIGIASKNRIVTEDAIKNMREAQRKVAYKKIGIKLPEETKLKMSKSRKGKKLNMTEEGRRTLSILMSEKNKKRKLAQVI